MTQAQWDEVFAAVQRLSDVCEEVEPDPESQDDLDLILALGDHLIALALMVRHKRFESDELDALATMDAAPGRKVASH